MDLYTIFAVKSLQDNLEESFKCNTLWAALKKFRECKRKGYEVIDVHYRKFIKVDTSNWNQITLS